MRRLQFGTFVLTTALGGCDPMNDEQHEDHTSPTTTRDAGGMSECQGRGEPLTDMVLRPRDKAIDATLSLAQATPERPIVGNNSWLFDLEIEGEAASGLTSAFTVTPFMPDHGHGTPTIVRIEEVEVGRYELEPVHTRMAGYWEVTVLVEAPIGELSFIVKVCVD